MHSSKMSAPSAREYLANSTQSSTSIFSWPGTPLHLQLSSNLQYWRGILPLFADTPLYARSTDLIQPRRVDRKPTHILAGSYDVSSSICLFTRNFVAIHPHKARYNNISGEWNHQCANGPEEKKGAYPSYLHIRWHPFRVEQLHVYIKLKDTPKYLVIQRNNLLCSGKKVTNLMGKNRLMHIPHHNNNNMRLLLTCFQRCDASTVLYIYYAKLVPLGGDPVRSAQSNHCEILRLVRVASENVIYRFEMNEAALAQEKEKKKRSHTKKPVPNPYHPNEESG